MSRYKIRIGNDLAIQWSFFQDRAKTIPLSLTGRDLSVYLSNTTTKWKLPSIVVEGNFVGFTLLGVDQLNKYGTGIFNLTCIENEGQENQHVLDMITPLLFVSQAEESISGSAEGTWTLLETGVAYFGSAALTYFETIEHAEQTYAKKTDIGGEVHYDISQELSDSEKEVARENIGAQAKVDKITNAEIDSLD